ncbi:MAG: hypothetical protein LBT22_08050, partial [Peptococcaceae bacterium]|nr:hypothetical protein [Peptococcaceae bacterium]
MSNYGRRQPRNMGGKDLQSLAVWVVIIGVIGYLLFPSFFKELYFSRTEAVTSTGGTNEVRLPGDYQSVSSNELPSEVYSEAGNNFKPLYGQDNAMATGYWAIMTVSGNLRELSLSGEDYAFILKMIQNDQ